MGLTLAQVSNLLIHTNWTGEVDPDTSANAAICGGAAGFAWDTDGTVYINGNASTVSGPVKQFDSSGNILRTLGSFSGPVGTGSSYTSARDGGGMMILRHPTRGKWLIVSDGPAWDLSFQLMAIDAFDSGGNVITPGTLTNVFGPVTGGISGQTGGWDLDDVGNLWVISTNSAPASPPLLIHATFTGDTTFAQIGAATNFNTLYGWTRGNNVKFDPVTRTLVLWGNNGSSNIVARVDQNAGFAILLSTTSLNFSQPIFIASDGNYVVANGANVINKISAATLTVVQSQNLITDYNLLGTIDYVWYDVTNNFLWIRFQSTNSVAVLDLTNPSITTGAVTLVDGTDSSSFGGSTTVTSFVGFSVSVDGSRAVTTVGSGGSPAVSFIDFWGSMLPMIIIGHALNLLSSHYQM